jgi:predicted lipopolysaccharide heptosyltransferase III
LTKPKSRTEIRVLLVRLRQVGDVALTTPAIHAVRNRFPAAHIAYVVESAAADIVAVNPHLDEVIVAPARHGMARVGEELTLVRRLRAGRYDLAIDFHGGPRASMLTWLSGAPERIGYDVVGRGWMYTTRIARPRELRPRHSVENQWDLLAPLDIGPPDANAFPIEIPVDPAAERRVATRLTQAGVNGSERLIVIHVSASSPFRRWPADAFVAAIADLACAGVERRILVTSGPSEIDAANRIIADARARVGGAEAERILQCGEFSLAELRALVERAAVYIGGDSGPLHLAAASRAPIVALYGPTMPVRSTPWRAAAYPTETVDAGPLPCRPCDQRVCIPGDFRCLTRIEPAAVVSAAERLLSGDPKRVAPQTSGWGATLSGSRRDS